MVPRGFPGVVFFLLFSTLPSIAVSDNEASGKNEARQEFHLTGDVARRLYAVSAFAHGHRHGYERGYMDADQEIHFGRNRRDLRPKDVPDSMKYRREYGDKKRFRQGFIYGFLAGYRDSFDDRAFRLQTWSPHVPPFSWMSELPQSDEPAMPDRTLRARFDEGLQNGYRSALGSQLASDDPKEVAGVAEDSCADDSKATEPGYCDGFVQGYLLGANDQGSLSPGARSASSALGHVP